LVLSAIALSMMLRTVRINPINPTINAMICPVVNVITPSNEKELPPVKVVTPT
jgi:hypothetical protein